MKRLLTISALASFAGICAASLCDAQAQGNDAIQRQLDRGTYQMQQQLNRNAITGLGKPAFPLFRCDGQRPPIFGADDCQNWRIMQKQERLLDLQIKELQRRERR
jgi:hypothetical protein